MLTILNILELSEDYLQKKGVESARINAELLLANILKCKRMDLYLKFDQPLKDNEIIDYRAVLKRRGNREPLQYIIGTVEFYGLEFSVNSNVLIPRQETEILVENVLNSCNNNSTYKILDIGTGSGNIAVSIANSLPNSFVHSIDISGKAIDIAKDNAIDNNVADRVTFQNIDVNDYNINGGEKFDTIVSNPPYISIEEYNSLEIELLDHEPKNALTDNNNGYSFYELISNVAQNLLNSGGNLFFEVGIGQAKKVENIMSENGFKNIKTIKDYLDIDRVIIGEYS